MFSGNDLIHLKNLMEMIRDNLTLDGLSCQKVSEVYHAFQWLQGLEAKINDVTDLQRENQDLREALENESIGLVREIEGLQALVKELREEKVKKPKKKAKKKTKKEK